MSYLVDTSVLVRLANVADSSHSSAANAMLELHRLKEMPHLTPQNLIEFRNAATRPLAQNGLGLSAAEAEAKAAVFEATMHLLPDSPNVYPTWKSLVSVLGIIGKQVHDARLVAVCHVHSVSHVLTFNVRHFSRMATFGPGIVLVDAANF
jgi:predicted nucleic acid-binding protein